MSVFNITVNEKILIVSHIVCILYIINSEQNIKLVCVKAHNADTGF